MAFVLSVVAFFMSLLISALVIYAVTKLMGEREGFGTALVAGFIGALIYALAYHFLPGNLISGLVAGFAWLIALSKLYRIGWIKSFVIAILIWFLATLVGYFLPTLVGPF
jgi:hypothetical protein